MSAGILTVYGLIKSKFLHSLSPWQMVHMSASAELYTALGSVSGYGDVVVCHSNPTRLLWLDSEARLSSQAVIGRL